MKDFWKAGMGLLALIVIAITALALSGRHGPLVERAFDLLVGFGAALAAFLALDKGLESVKSERQSVGRGDKKPSKDPRRGPDDSP